MTTGDIILHISYLVATTMPNISRLVIQTLN